RKRSSYFVMKNTPKVGSSPTFGVQFKRAPGFFMRRAPRMADFDARLGRPLLSMSIRIFTQHRLT
ncbi:hypothetical protein, partial [Burkholderia territorii]|uniref:hypothetical protein n=1 Tax=Burkholderia territorii TaxID=1503055 RepID=UPI001E4A60D0